MKDISVIDSKCILTCFILILCVGLTTGSSGALAEQETPTDSLGLTPLVSNVFYETDLKEVLLNISDQTGVPIVADQTVQGYITMAISDMPLDQCLRRILEPLGYTFKKVRDYYLVGSARPDNPAFHLLSVTETITPNYLKAVDIAKLVSSYYDPYLKVDDRTNRLTITAAPDIVKRFKEDLNEIDTAPRQIMIEVVVTELSEVHLKEYGLEALIQGTKDGRTGILNILTGGVMDSSLQVTGARIGDVLNGWAIDYQAVLKALVRDGVADIRANPQLATQEGQPAKIFVGKDQYYTISTGLDAYVYTRLEVIKVGISLEITPYVSSNDDITIELKCVVSDVTGMGATGLPVISTRDVSTRIQVRNGESIVIGGLQTEDKRKVVKKVPLLGDIPILGFFFRSTSFETKKSEIVIMITPHLLEATDGS